jgi:hypothetical protein
MNTDAKKMAVGVWGMAAGLGVLYGLGHVGFWLMSNETALATFDTSHADANTLEIVGVGVIAVILVAAWGFALYLLAALAWHIGNAVYKGDG